MAASITNVKLGPCSVTFNGDDLGHTKGGVTVSYEPEYYDIQVDKYGTSIAEKVLVGENMTVTVPLAESTISNFAIAIPAGINGTTKLTIGTDAGERMLQYAKQLVLHPLANEVSDLDEDVVIYKAIVSEGIEFKYVVDGERVAEVVFQALIDETKLSGNRLGLIGDSTT